MGDFTGRAEGERLLAVLKTGIMPDRKKPSVHEDANPLYSFNQSAAGNSYKTHAAIEDVFRLLKRNGYGDTFVAKTDERFRNEAGQNLGSGDPSWAAAADKTALDKTMYLINDRLHKNACGPHFLAERICDGTFHAILFRAMELGSNVKPPYVPQSRAPAPMQPRF